MDREKFVDSCIEALLWSEAPDGSINWFAAFISGETKNAIRADCEDFLARCAEEELLHIIKENPAQAGHDFVLSRNGHGAGFFDGKWGHHGDKLHRVSREFGPFHLYEVPDGPEIYHHS